MLIIRKRVKQLIAAIFILLIVLCTYFKPWQSMFEKESKLKKDSNVSFFVIDNKEYSLYEKMLSDIQNDSSNRKKIINSITSDLSEALQKKQYKFESLNILDFGEVNNLYEHTYFDAQSGEKSRENLLRFLATIKMQSDVIKDDDFNYLLDFYFYYSCVVSFNKYWYLQPQIPISKTLVDGLLNHSLRLKQIYNFDSSANILEPIKVNFIGGGYNRIKNFASDEFLSTIMVMPMLRKEHPRNIEANNFILLRGVLTSNPSFSLCVFYIP